MAIVYYLHIALKTRMVQLREEPDRGDSPVPTAIIIAGLAAIAVALVAAASGIVDGWMDGIDTAP